MGLSLENNRLVGDGEIKLVVVANAITYIGRHCKNDGSEDEKQYCIK